MKKIRDGMSKYMTNKLWLLGVSVYLLSGLCCAMEREEWNPDIMCMESGWPINGQGLTTQRVLIDRKNILVDRIQVSLECIEYIRNYPPKFPWKDSEYRPVQTPYDGKYLVFCADQEVYHKLLAFETAHPYTCVDQGWVKSHLPKIDPADTIAFWQHMKPYIQHREAPITTYLTDFFKHPEYFMDDPNLYFIALLTRKKMNDGGLKSSQYAASDSYAYHNPIFEYNYCTEGSGTHLELYAANLLRSNSFLYAQDIQHNNPSELSVEMARHILLGAQIAMPGWRVLLKGE